MARGTSMVQVGPGGALLDEMHDDKNPGFDPGQVGADELSDDLALLNTLAQIGESESEAKVNVYQIDGAKKDVFLYSCSVGEFASSGLEEIQSRYGAGDYRIRVYSGGRVLTHRRVSVGAPRDTSRLIGHETKPAGPDLSVMLAQQSQMMLEGFKQIAEAMRANAAPPPSRSELLNDMVMFKQLFGGGEAKAGPDFGSLMDIFKQGMDMGRMGAGEPSTSDVLLKGLEAFAPLAQAALSAQGGARLATGAAMPAVPSVPMITSPAASVVQSQPASTMQPQPESQDMNLIRQQMLKQYLGFLVVQAKQNSDVYTYANMVLDNVPEAEVRAFLGADNWLENLAQINSAVKEPGVEQWFAQLRAAVIELLTEESGTGMTAIHAANTLPVGANTDPDKTDNG